MTVTYTTSTADGHTSVRWVWWAIAASGGLSVVAYWPAIGAGFQSDDFRWLWHARISGWVDVTRVFTESLGFYRPFTQLLWAFDLARSGPDPTAFSATNVALHVVVLVLFGVLARRLLRDPVAAAAATVLAALGHQYASMAVNWISGRGALLGAAASLAALVLWDRWCTGEGGVGSWLGALAAMAVGLGAYEAVALVPLLMAMMIGYRGDGGRKAWSAAGPLALWVPYFAARLGVGARQPWNEGEGYAYEVAAMLPNLLEYVGRVVWVDAVLIVVVLTVALAVGALAGSARGAVDGLRETAALGSLWFVCGVLPGLPVVSRSSLYVYFAALGIHLIAGAALAAAVRQLQGAHYRAGVAAMALCGALVLFAWPLFAWDRNERIADQGRLSMASIATIRTAAPEPGIGACIVLWDDPQVSPNLRDALSHDLYWLGAFVYSEPPSNRIRYGDLEAGEPCTRTFAFHLASEDSRAVLRSGAPR